MSVIHTFESLKSDSPDTTLVSSSEWNDSHSFSGGINGQTLVYDNTEPYNMRWTDGIQSFLAGTYTISSSTPTPLNDILLITFTTTSPVKGLSSFFIGNLTTVGAVSTNVRLNVDNVPGYSPDVASATVGISFTADLDIPTPGVHTVSIDLVVTGNANILTLNASNRIIIFGV